MTREEELQQEVNTLRREKTLHEVADAADVKFNVLRTLDRPDLAYEIKNEAGKKTVMVKAGNGQPTEFSAFAGAAWPDFMPALTAGQRVKGTPFVKQNGGGYAPPVPTMKDQIVGAVLSKYKARK